MSFKRILTNPQQRISTPVWAALLLVAVAVRASPWPHLFSDGGLYLYGGDVYMHLRKIVLHLSTLPFMATHDYYEGFPVGTPAIWPPLLDYLTAVICWIAGFGNPDARQIEAIASLLPPLLGALTTIPVYLFARMTFTPRVGWISVLLFLAIPAHLEVTVAGRFDHEMTETLLVCCLFIAFTRIVSDEQEGWYRASTLALVGVVTLLFWRGATLWILLITAIAGLIVVRQVLGRDYFHGFKSGDPSAFQSSLGKRLARALFIMSILLACLVTLNPFGNQWQFSFNIVSWFQPVLFAALALSIRLFEALCNYWLNTGRKAASLIIVIAILLALAALLVFLIPALRSNLTAGLGMLGFGETNPWIDSIVEYQPLWALYSGNPLGIGLQFGWLIFPAPVIACYLLWSSSRTGNVALLSFALLLVSTIILTLFRIRFAHVLVIPVVIMSAWCIDTILASLTHHRLLRRFTVPVVVATLLLFILPFFYQAYLSSQRAPGFSYRGYIENAMHWLANNTPPAHLDYTSSDRPDYGVLARWDFGGWLEYIARRPAVAALYGTETHGMREVADFYTTRDAQHAGAIMQANAARYVMLTNEIGNLSMYEALLGGNQVYSSLRQSPQGFFFHAPAADYFNLVSTRLLMADGQAMQVGSIHFAEAPSFRLLYESAERLPTGDFPIQVSRLKIYQHTEPHRMQVIGSSTDLLAIESIIETNQGRRFVHRTRGLFDQPGVVSFATIYPRKSTADTTGRVSPYRLYDGLTQKWYTLNGELPTSIDLRRMQ